MHIYTVDVERVMGRAYETWRRAFGFFVVNGVISYIILLLLVLAIVLALGVDLNNIESLPPWKTYAFGLFYLLAIVIQYVYLVVAAHAGREGKYNYGKVFRTLFRRFLPVATAALLVMLTLFTGVLLAQIFLGLALTGIPGMDVVGALILLTFLYAAVRFSLAPYYAVKERWEEAVKKSMEKTGKHFMSILLIEIFFVLVTLFLISIHPLVYILINAFFLAHFVNLTFFEMTGARR